MANYVMDPISSFTDKRGPTAALAAYSDTTSWIVDLRGQNDKVLIVKNSGGAGLTYNVLGSIDAPEYLTPEAADFVPEWDMTHLGDTVVAPAGINVQKFPDYYTYLKIQIKGVGGIATIKLAATGN